MENDFLHGALDLSNLSMFWSCNTYAALLDPVFIECRPSNHFGLQVVVDALNELECQGLEAVSTPQTILVRGRLTLRIVVGGIQCVRRSYSRARHCSSLAGDRSARISWAIIWITTSQSGGGIGVLSVTFSLVGKSVSAAWDGSRRILTYFCA